MYIHTWIAYLQIPNFFFCQYHLVAQVAFWGEMAQWAKMLQMLVKVCRFLSASSVSADSLLCHFGIQCSRLFDFF
jgi:hypothetical protein